MSIKVLDRVWHHADLGGSELLVLLAMADFSDDEGGNIYPSVNKLAQKARLSTSQARRVVKKLIEAGYIYLVEQGGWTGYRNRANEYRIILDSMKEEVQIDNDDTPLQDDTPSREREGGTSADARGGTSADASTVLAPMLPQPSYNRNSQPLEEPSSLASADDDDEPPQSDEQQTKALTEKLHSIGVGLTPFLVDAYMDLASDYGMEPVIRGLTAAAENGKQHRMAYVKACIENIVQGNERAQEPAQPQREPPKTFRQIDEERAGRPTVPSNEETLRMLADKPLPQGHLHRESQEERFERLKRTRHYDTRY